MGQATKIELGQAKMKGKSRETNQAHLRQFKAAREAV